MTDNTKSREDLLNEIISLRGQVAELEAREAIRAASRNSVATETLNELEEEFRILVENAHEGIHVAQDGILKFVNPALAQIYEKSQEELLSRPFAEFIHPDDRELVVDRSVRRARGEKLPSRYVHKLLIENQKTKWVEINSAAITWQGKPAVLVFSNDVTDAKMMEEAIKDRDEQYRNLVEESFDGIVVTRGMKIAFVNSRLCQMFGYSEEEMLGMDIWLLVDTDSQDLAKKRAVGRMRGESIQSHYEAKLRRSDGSLFDGEVIAKAIERQGTPGVQVWVKDITERKQAEQALRESEKKLLQAQKMEAVGTLAGGIAHDFNNMLTVILGFAELLLLDADKDSPNRADLQKIIDTAAGGASLVKRLLTFSQQTETKPEPLDLRREVERVSELLYRTIPKMISLDLSLADEVAPVYGDSVQIEQVVMNLALNAREAMADEGKLTIEVKNVVLDEAYCSDHTEVQPGDYVLLAVSDTGRGMDEQTIERMFDPFFSTKDRGTDKGTGLGLAVVHSIVEQHNGHITCDTRPGKGTRFEIYFPVMKPETHTEDVPRKLAALHGTETILLVDDEDFVRDLGERILSRAGYRVLTARNGREALEVYQKGLGKISLVVLDIVMPEMGGRQCIPELLNIDPKARILISTGYSSVDDKSAQDTAALASGLIRKPYTVSNLLGAVREILDRP